MGVREKLFRRKNEPPKVDQPSGASTEDAYGLKFSQENGETRTFVTLPITIGRDPSNDFPLAEDTVSSRHARVYYDEAAGAVCIEDLDSTNGIAIQNLPTRKNALQDGVIISLGNIILTFRDTGYIHPGS